MTVIQDALIGESKNYIIGWYSEGLNFPSKTWEGPEIRVGEKLTVNIPAKTKWWGYFGVAYAMFPNGDYSDTDWNDAGWLINKKGTLFPDYYDNWRKMYASDNVMTNWTKGATHTRPSTDALRKAYIDMFGDPMINFSLYDMHHIRPLAYGVDNGGYNLMPVIRPNHYQVGLQITNSKG